MKRKILLGVSSALCLCATIAQAQETNDVIQLKQQLQQMRENQDEQRQQIEALTKKLDEMTAQPNATSNVVTPDQLKELDDKVNNVVEAQKKTLPGEFNPAIGVVGETLFSYRSRNSDQTGSDRPGGFDVQLRSVELNVAASVDPFAKGWVVANASADAATGEATFGIEEAALQTTSLPGNLTLTAGRFFGEFGRLGYIHDHELPFVNRPLVLNEYIGGESQSDGLQLNWLLPMEHYVSATVGVGDHFGGDSPNPDHPGNFRPITGLNLWGRLSSYWDLPADWQMEAGVSGLWQPKEQDRGGFDAFTNSIGNPITERERRLAGIDFKLSYVPLQNNQFRSFTWGTEILYSDNRYLADPDSSLAGTPPTFSGDEFMTHVGSVGAYSYVNYKWSRQWSGGFLSGYVQSPFNHSDQTYEYSPFITFALSHWNQLRLQYTHTGHDAASGLKSDDAVYLQWAFIIGAHSHGWTQR